MIALIQRVSRASVAVGSQTISQIGEGVLAFIAIQQADERANADKLLHKLLNYRVFEDDSGRMNLNLLQIRGGLMLVPQFTLAADTSRGLRPGFSHAATPQMGEALFNYLVQQAKSAYDLVYTGEFGADMQISLVNQGPATFWLQT